MELTSSTSSRGYLFVLQCGLVTSAIALAAAWWMPQQWPEFNPMGFFYEGFIPVGAFSVGLVAGTGYAWGSWLAGVRVAKVLLVLIILGLIGAYFASHYVQFRAHHYVYKGSGLRVPFWTWFHFSTMSLRFVSNTMQQESLGYAGYLIRLGELAGFSLGGMIIPLAMRAQPYCSDCQRYKRDRKLGAAPTLPIPEGTIERDEEENEEEPASSTPIGPQSSPELLDFTSLRHAVESHDLQNVRAILALLGSRSKADAKSNCITEVSVRYCPCCMNGELTGVVIEKVGLETHIDLAPKMKLTAPMVKALVG
jgi:hypothetical protein